MKVDKKLVEKFFAGQCTPYEAQIVSAFLDKEENREIYLSTAEWEAFVPDSEIPDEVSKRIHVEITNAIHQQREAKITRLRYIAYAASITLFVSIGLLLYRSSQQAPHQAAASINKPVSPASAPVVSTVLKNTSAKTHSYNLPDGSVVEIGPMSEISYAPLDGDRRDIMLKGEALFRVHKDAKRPFTVYANQLATTALGTIFKVSAFKHHVFTTVKLIEGKVVVKPQNQLLAAGVKTVYLTPGKMFTVNIQSYAAQVKSFIIPAAKQTEAFDNNKTIITDQSIVFDNQRLSQVFTILSKKLNVNITFSNKSVNKKLFSGQYEFGRDDAETFLNTVASLNGLVVEKTATGYHIKTK